MGSQVKIATRNQRYRRLHAFNQDPSVDSLDVNVDIAGVAAIVGAIESGAVDLLQEQCGQQDL